MARKNEWLDGPLGFGAWMMVWSAALAMLANALRNHLPLLRAIVERDAGVLGEARFDLRDAVEMTEVVRRRRGSMP